MRPVERNQHSISLTRFAGKSIGGMLATLMLTISFTGCLQYRQNNMDPARWEIAYLYSLLGGALGGPYTISGTITGLSADGLVLQNNGIDDISPASGDTTFAFPEALENGAAYNVTVASHPSGNTCTVTNGSGSVWGADVTNVQVDCAFPKVVQIAAGGSHTCVLFDAGNVRCWGNNASGQLGYGNTDLIGDNEDPAVAGDVDLGGSAVQISAGLNHSCARLSTGDVVCWGDNASGQLGYGHMNNIGDDELPSAAGVVDVGGVVTHISAGGQNTCALLDSGDIRCWGRNDIGHLGYNNGSVVIGDDEVPSAAGPVMLSTTASTMEVSMNAHTCPVLTTGELQCWGRNANGELGYNNGNMDIGDDEHPTAETPLNVGATITSISTGGNHSCYLLDTGSIRCWGRGLSGATGYGDETNRLDATSVTDVNVGGTVSEVAAGYYRSCALLNTGSVRCWGSSPEGQLGYADTLTLGDGGGEMPTPDVDVGTTVTGLGMGHDHICVITDTGSVRCWGSNTSGQLGYGHTNHIGDDEHPSSAGDVKVLGP